MNAFVYDSQSISIPEKVDFGEGDSERQANWVLLAVVDRHNLQPIPGHAAELHKLAVGQACHLQTFSALLA